MWEIIQQIGGIPPINPENIRGITADCNKQPKVHNKHIVQWAEASSPSRPAIVFVPGFMTQTSKSSPMDAWTPDIIQLARQYDFAAYGLYWPSGSLMNLLLGDQWMSTTAAFAGLRLGALGMFGLPMLLNPILLGPVLGIGGPLIYKAMSTWKKAVEIADQTAENPDAWLSAINRPTILIGHSLGGRIALQASRFTKSTNILQTYALAPAILEDDCDFTQVNANIKGKSVVYYSENDAILNFLYRAGELTLTQPLGFTGVQKKKHRSDIQSFNVSTWKGHEMGHQDYNLHIHSLLHHPRLAQKLQNWS